MVDIKKEASKETAIDHYLVKNNISKDQFKIISRIGQVYDFKKEYRYRNEFKYDVEIGDFKMTKNSNKSIFDLAKIYGFYESSNGINVKGKEIPKTTEHKKTNSFENNEPVLVGDIYIDKDKNRYIMIDTVNTFKGSITKDKVSSYTWIVTYQCVVEKDFKYPVLQAKEEIEKPLYYESMLNSKKTIENEVVKLVETLVTQISLCQSTAPGAPIGTLLLIPVMEDAIKKFKKAIYDKDDKTGKEVGILVEEDNNSYKL